MQREYEFRRRAKRDAERHKKLVMEWYVKEESIRALINNETIKVHEFADGTVQKTQIPVPSHLDDHRLIHKEGLQQGIGHDDPSQDGRSVGASDGQRVVDKDEVGAQKGTIMADDEKADGDEDGNDPHGDDAGDDGGDRSMRQQFLAVEMEELLWRLFQERYDLPFMEELTRGPAKKESYAFLPEEARVTPERFLPEETFREYLKRIRAEAATEDDTVDDESGVVIPLDIRFQETDVRVRTPVDDEGDDADLVLGIILDRTGSMGTDKLVFAKEFALFLVLYLRYRYSVQAVRLLLILHDTEAYQIAEEKEEEFWQAGASGGTHCSAGWLFAREVIERDYSEENVYLLALSDGLNSAVGDDNEICADTVADLIKKKLVRRVMYVELQKASSPPRKDEKHYPGFTEYYAVFADHPVLGPSPRFVQHRMRDEHDLQDLLRIFCTLEYEEVTA